jgi:hypothetical protein
MNKELLNIAIDALAIRDVSLHASRIAIAEEFDPVFPEYEAVNLQFRQGPKGMRRLHVQGPEAQEQIEILRVHFECAFRALAPEAAAEETLADDVREPHVLATVEATFAAYYQVNKELEEDAIREFVKRNVGYHIWPYWREYASSVGSRLRLPRFTLPFYRVPQD